MVQHMVVAGVVLLVATASPPGQGARPGVRVERDVVFAETGKAKLKLDLALPEGDGPFPVVLCIHGGGWVSGDRRQLSQTIEALARQGFAAVTCDYRLAPTDHFPAQVEDCKAAVRFLRANAGKYGLDPDRIGAVGFASGGHLACLLGVTGKEDGLEGNGGNADQSSRLQAVVSFFGPTDLTRRDWTHDTETKNLLPFLGGTLAEKPELYRKASPAQYACKDAPPFLFLHGDSDPVVPLRQSELLARKLEEAGGWARVSVVEGEGHGWHGEKLRNSIADMILFFNEHLKK
jgi:acetyl esterase/lipase